ncbi:MAG: ester cyclase [Hyphomicrobiales bacterium]
MNVPAKPLIVASTPEEQANIRLSIEHFAAESAHDNERTLKTLSDDVMYRVVASGEIVYGKEAVSKYYDVWWTAFPDVQIEIRRMVAVGEWVFAENFVTATHLGPWLGLAPTGKKAVQHLCAVIRCRDGLMTEESVYYDQLERLCQIGSDFTMDGKPINVPKWKTPPVPRA